MNGTWVCVVVLSGNCNINFCFIAAWREIFSAGGCYRQHTHYFGLEEVQYFGFCILFNSDFFNLWSRLNCFLNCIRSIKHSDNVKAPFQVEYDKNGGVWVLDFHLNLTRCNFVFYIIPETQICQAIRVTRKWERRMNVVTVHFMVSLKTLFALVMMLFRRSGHITNNCTSV